MTTGRMAARGLPLAAVALAAVVGLCLTGTRPPAVRAGQKEQEKGKEKVSPSAHVDPACDYLKGSEPTFEKAGDIKPAIGLCEGCHLSADQGIALTFAKYKSTEFVRLNESTTWKQQDIHAAAMDCLTQPLGKQMEEILKKNRPEGYTVAKAAECLTCHSADKSPRKPLADKRYEDFATAPNGVTCTLCHGMHQRWQVAHYDEPEQAGQPMPWRAKSPAEKFAAGMHDLRNPVVKAQLCVSCHVGSAAEGRVVTHEIYAAGHPPLPPFELASYMEAEPRHWGYPTELKYFTDYAKNASAESTWKVFHFHPAEKEVYLARHLAVGAVVSLRAEAELILADAERAAKEGDVLDFARFDCYACHHELLPKSARQARGYGGLPPGRTPVRASAGATASLVAAHAVGIKSEDPQVKGLAAKAAGFDERWNAVRKDATARPLGHAKSLTNSAKAVKEWCDEFLRAQSSTAAPVYTADETNRLRAMLAAAATDTKAVTDPETALFLAWGTRTLTTGGKGDHPSDPKLGEVVPVNVRTAPFTTQTGGPTQAKFAERMKKVATFDGLKFTEVFGGVFPK